MSIRFESISARVWQATDEGSTLKHNTYLVQYKPSHYLVYNPSTETLDAAHAIIATAEHLDLLAASASYLQGLLTWRNEFQKASVWGADPVSKIFTSRLGIARSGAIGMLHDSLPDSIRIKPVPTSHHGECWVHIEEQDKHYILASDSMMNLPTQPDDWMSKVKQKLNGLHEGFCISHQFKRKVSLGGFRNWSQTQLKPYEEFTLLPTIGEPLNVRTEDAMRYINERFSAV